MSIIIASNNASSTLLASINSTTTTISVAAGTGHIFPSPTAGQAFKVSLTDAATKLQHEIMLCTNRTNDTLTVVRGQEGTTAQGWTAGDYVANLMTSGTLTAFLPVEQSQQNTYGYAAVSGTSDAITATLISTLTVANVGMTFTLTAAFNNITNSPTMTLVLGTTGIGPFLIFKGNGVPLATGDITAGATLTFAYNLVNNYPAFILLNPATSPLPSTYSMPTGSITMWPTATAPNGWVLCNGQALSRSAYSALFSIIGLTFGTGDGSSTFNVPNYTNLMPIGAGGIYGAAATGGSASTTLSTANLPSHNHSAVSTSSSTSNSISTSNSVSNSTSTSTPTGTATSTSVSTPTGTATSTSVSTTTGSAISTSSSNTTGSAASSSSSTFSGNALPTHVHSVSDPGHFHTWTNQQQAGRGIILAKSGGGSALNNGSTVQEGLITINNAQTGISIVGATGGTPSGSVFTTTNTQLQGLGTTTNTSTSLALSTHTTTNTTLALSTATSTTTSLTLSTATTTNTTTATTTNTATTTGTTTSTTIGNTGSGTAISTISPYLAIYFIIKT